MLNKIGLAEAVKGIRETCPACKNEYGMKCDKVSILAYGRCPRCLLEQQLGHTYTPKTWDCECGKKFMTKKNLDRHCSKFNHQQFYKQEDITHSPTKGEKE